MGDAPTVSVIVLNMNGKPFLKDCLESLLAVRYPAARRQILLADNASTDGSVQYVEENFPDVKVRAFEENIGFSAGNNIAAREASSDYVLTLNSDTLIQPDCLDQMVDACRHGISLS